MCGTDAHHNDPGLVARPEYLQTGQRSNFWTAISLSLRGIAGAQPHELDLHCSNDKSALLAYASSHE